MYDGLAGVSAEAVEGFVVGNASGTVDGEGALVGLQPVVAEPVNIAAIEVCDTKLAAVLVLDGCLQRSERFHIFLGVGGEEGHASIATSKNSCHTSAGG